MNLGDVKLNDEVIVISPAYTNTGHIGRVISYGHKTGIEKAATEFVRVMFEILPDIRESYDYEPADLRINTPQRYYSIWKEDGESNRQFEERQTEIRKNFHKVRPGEGWAEYENRTGLVNPIGQVYGCYDGVKNKPVPYTDSQLSTMNQIALAANRTLTVFVDYDERGIYEKSKEYSNLQFLVWY